MGNELSKSSKIYVAGHKGLVGSAIVRKLTEKGYDNLVLRSSKELDLRSQKDVEDFFLDEKPEFVFQAAAKVGGILANSTYPADFIFDNLMIQTNIIHSSYKANVKKLLFLGSSCIFPRLAPQPMKEEYLLTGPLEPTNEAYAVAKIAGIRMCTSYNEQFGTNYICAMPANLYGPGDNFDLESSHFLPAMIHKLYEAKVRGDGAVTLWGTGSPRRELLFVDDLADACVFLMKTVDSSAIGEFINVGSGKDFTIKEYAELVRKIIGFSGEILWDSSKPDGMPQKLLDTLKITSLGWRPKVNLEEGIEITYEWYKKI